MLKSKLVTFGSHMENFTVTIGNKRHGAIGEYVGRPSPLGNPNPLDDDDEDSRYQNIYGYLGYRSWLLKKIREDDKAVCDELRRLRRLLEQNGKLTLVCWCAPKLCHAEVIKEILLKLVGN